MYTIATLYQLRQRLGLADSDTDDDIRLLHALQAASTQIERQTNRHFCPRLATIDHDMNPAQATELLLIDDLLELTTLTNGDGSSIDLDDALTIPDSDGAVAVIRLTGGTAFCWDLTPLRAVEVTGIWGWHDRWSQAWRDSADTVQDAPLSDSATSLTVSDADGADAENETPRFQVGHLLRIEDEYLRVLAVNTTTNVLTVQRGINGTTAAAHAQTTAIEIYQPPQDVQNLTLRWASWLYKEPDNRTFSGTPANLTRALEGLHRVGVKA